MRLLVALPALALACRTVVEGEPPAAQLPADTGADDDTAGRADTGPTTGTLRFTNATEVGLNRSYYYADREVLDGFVLQPGGVDEITVDPTYFYRFVWREDEGAGCWHTDSLTLEAGDVLEIEITELPYGAPTDESYPYCQMP